MLYYWTWTVTAYFEGKPQSFALQMPQGTASLRSLTKKLRSITGKAWTISDYKLQG